MSNIRDYFLRAKHWQIFLMFLVFFLLSPVALFSSTKVGPPAFIGLTIVYELCFLFWFWSMGSFLSMVVQPRLRLNMRFFLFALAYPLLYSLVFFWYFESPSPAAVIIPLHLFAMFCIIYVLYFVSKSFLLAERRTSVTFSSYAGIFVLCWFFPIGVWIIQPRINRLYCDQGSAMASF